MYLQKFSKLSAFATPIILMTATAAFAQGLSTGSYVMNQQGDCATLVLRGAGPQGNEYRFDEGCNGQNVFTAQSVRVTGSGVQVDQGEMRNIAVDASGFTTDWVLRGQTTRGLVFRRQ